jgi:hypothetical protein
MCLDWQLQAIDMTEYTPYRPPSESTIRRVWHYVSLHPHSSLPEIASGVQRSTNCTWRAPIS